RIRTLPPYPDAEVLVPEGHFWVQSDEPFRTSDRNTFGTSTSPLLSASSL
ncbi:hypothetical protein OG21DRAFT_1423396, partial [Imleria badia]